MSFTFLSLSVNAQAVDVQNADSTDYDDSKELEGVAVVSQTLGMRRIAGAQMGQIIGKNELFRAACCNLGESFTTNPSVDVNYSDAVTGAKQIKLLGLSGTYVQMLTENMPNFRGAATPYSLSYVPGPWMKSIQVSKGAASVRNGYESITGQINVQYLQPEDEEGVTVNIYGDSKARFEANADGNIHINDRLSTELLLHYDDTYKSHDENDDGFIDKPKIRQYNLQNRWAYLGDTYIFHGGLSFMKDKRQGGQLDHHGNMSHSGDLYKIGIETDRYEMYMKHAFVLNKEHGTNLALMASGSIHKMDGLFGKREYNVDNTNVYAQLMFETNFTKRHNLSAGLSFNNDNYDESFHAEYSYNKPNNYDSESVTGAYAQYTFNLNERFIAMAGIRADYSSVFEAFVTPRMHLKWMIADWVTLRGAIGKGYRNSHTLAENSNLLATSRHFIDKHVKMEEAWNYGFSAGFNIPVGNREIKVNAEYYYTDFVNQAIIDYDADPYSIRVYDSNGQKSYSHVFQIDAFYPIFDGFTLTAAYRRNIVKATYNNQLLDKPLTNKYKGLVSLGYKTPLGLWQFDITLQLNGGGRLPQSYTFADGTYPADQTFSAYEQLSAQVTRWFRHFSVYVGGENLTGFKQKNPIIDASNPWGNHFDTTMVWGPVHGPMFYAGVRFNFGRL